MNAPAMVLPIPKTSNPIPVTDQEPPVVDNTTKTSVTEPSPPKVVDPAKPALATTRFRGLCPSNWHLNPGEGDQVTGINTRTGEQFAGTIEEFNALLRG